MFSDMGCILPMFLSCGRIRAHKRPQKQHTSINRTNIDVTVTSEAARSNTMRKLIGDCIEGIHCVALLRSSHCEQQALNTMNENDMFPHSTSDVPFEDANTRHRNHSRRHAQTGRRLLLWYHVNRSEKIRAEATASTMHVNRTPLNGAILGGAWILESQRP